MIVPPLTRVPIHVCALVGKCIHLWKTEINSCLCNHAQLLYLHATHQSQ